MNRLKLTEGELAARIKGIMDAIRSPAHADDIIELRRILKKHVPFYFRSYFAAYLLKDLVESGRQGPRQDGERQDGERRDGERRDGERRDGGRRDGEGKGGQRREGERKEPRSAAERGNGSRRAGERRDGERKDGRGSDRRGRDAEGRGGAASAGSANAGRDRSEKRGGDRSRQDERKPERPAQEQAEPRKQERHPPLPEGVESATLFVSAGRKRHFYPRHLLELFEGGGIPQDKVGEIRLFDNYMFVQIAADVAQEAVTRMDGVDFKGRKLAVNFARKREDEAERREGEEAAEGGGAPRGAGLGVDDGIAAPDAGAGVDAAVDEGSSDSATEPTGGSFWNDDEPVDDDYSDLDPGSPLGSEPDDGGDDEGN